MSSVKIFTNEVAGGWSPHDIEEMLGGSEECVVLLAEQMAASGHEVKVYHTPKHDEMGAFRKGVEYSPRAQFVPNPDDVVITFKDYTPWVRGVNARIKIHWSSDVEGVWDTSLVDHFVNLTEYHQRRNFFVRTDKRRVIPHGIDVEPGEKTEHGTMLYCSSPDRGLIELLQDWKTIRSHFPEMQLKVAYGFDLFDRVMGTNGFEFKRAILNLAKQPGISFLGTLSKDELNEQYRKAEYWVLPLQRPDSELFCLNAIKSRVLGCIPIVNKVGALENTVGDFIDYSEFVGGNPVLKESNRPVPAMDWAQIYENFWKKLL